jgi:ribosomal protein L28
MEMKTRAQSARDELQIGMNIAAWKNFDGDEQKKTKTRRPWFLNLLKIRMQAKKNTRKSQLVTKMKNK